MNILLAGAIIDFYVNRKRYEAYKTQRGRMNYVYSILSEYLKSLVGNIVNDIEIRDVSITSNNFWGIDEFVIINDLNYSCNNEVSPITDETKLPLRIFQIDLVGITETLPTLQEQFFEIKDKNFHLTISNAKVV